jgi:hypothetical protein
MNIEGIIDKSMTSFSRWDQHFKEYKELQERILDFSDTEHERVFYQTNDLLFDIAKCFFAFGNFKDTWDTSGCYINVCGQNLLLKSQKLGLTFHWGLESDEFYLYTHFSSPDNLRYMTDEFYTNLLKLKACGNLIYRENGRLDKKERPYLENQTSDVFCIIRNYLLVQVARMNNINKSCPPDMDLGSLEIRWNISEGWHKLLKDSCSAFKILYKLNYSLWKIDDIAAKKNR